MNIIMDYTTLPSLKNRAFTNIAITLYNHDDIRELLSALPFMFPRNMPNVNIMDYIAIAKQKLKALIEDEVLKYVLKLPIPDLLKKELLGFIEAVGWQLLKFKEYYKNKIIFQKHITKFYWKPQGTIDRKKSTKIYVKDESLDSLMRFEFACMQCLEDDICTLWKQFQERDLKLEITRSVESPYIAFWSHYIDGKLNLLSRTIRMYCRHNNITAYGITPNSYMFRISVEDGNITATKYFFSKLTSEEKEKILVAYGQFAVWLYVFGFGNDWESFADVSAFLISKMNNKQLPKLFEGCSYWAVLLCFLMWPRQTSFMKIARAIFSNPPSSNSTFTSSPVSDPKEEYILVLRCIVFRILHNYIGYNYKNLLLEFWQESHNAYKKFVTDHYADCYLLANVIKIDKANFQLNFLDCSNLDCSKHPLKIVWEV